MFLIPVIVFLFVYVGLLDYIWNSFKSRYILMCIVYIFSSWISGNILVTKLRPVWYISSDFFFWWNMRPMWYISFGFLFFLVYMLVICSIFCLWIYYSSSLTLWEERDWKSLGNNMAYIFYQYIICSYIENFLLSQSKLRGQSWKLEIHWLS